MGLKPRRPPVRRRLLTGVDAEAADALRRAPKERTSLEVALLQSYSEAEQDELRGQNRLRDEDALATLRRQLDHKED